MIPLLLVVLSLASLGYVTLLLILPEPHELAALVPLVSVAHDVPDTTLDWIGLV